METSTPILRSRRPLEPPTGSNLENQGLNIITPVRKDQPNVVFQMDVPDENAERAKRRKSTALRRSITNVPPAGDIITPIRNDRPSVAFQMDVPDENDERVERRRSMALRRSITNLPPAIGTSLNDSGIVFSENEMKMHLQLCSKLHAENKINSKNVWNLKIIDILKFMVKQGGPDLLRTVGNALEIAGKVYGLRVDDLHSEGLKLAGSLARNMNKRSLDDEENEENVDPSASVCEEGGERKKKKPKKRRLLLSGGKKHTVNPDPKSWKAPLPKLESTAFSSKTDPAISAIGNLYTNRVRMDPAGYKFMFLNKERAWQWKPGNDPSVKEDKKFPVKIKPFANLKLCAPFRDFQVDIWDPDRELSYSKELDEVVCDDNGVPIPELDGSIHDVFEERDNHGISEDEDMAGEPQIRQGIEHIVDFRPTYLTSSIDRSDYSFNSLVRTSAGKIDQIWAGPSHWKLKFIRRSVPVYTGQDQKDTSKAKKKAPRKKVEPELIDPSNLKDPVDPSEFSNVRLRKKKKVTDKSKIFMPLYDESCTELMDQIGMLMTIPTKMVKKRQPEVEFVVEGYRYDNPNDSQYVAQTMDHDDGGADLADDHFENGDVDRGSTPPDAQDEGVGAGLTGLNLVEAPQMVPQSYINYATRAKKMDMKLLKNGVWCALTQTLEADRSAKVVPTTFSQMYKEIPNILPEKMRQDLSCPMAFVALLHLANEQNLELKQEDFTDFTICGPSKPSES